ncbi:acetyl-CoA carboxylase biotin carboxyl carrier protein [Ruficoccus amylovorans]|uniref:Biotin carboxyl carrier protein of acetyl-CoA carboxylase n=1 Tax=Ruficoccus amylovorans TaxID=1804625 RepID=A0A842HK44_9BACT|nr:acetyl-CoA carboxylase biotin carboxyl carrier protein [Ruficoccus amylovorans]MBC2596318.1 acetyl-CoA carboxylase biotin carboxyl carrier protein [Ruficoccus amylovorans]
MDLKEIKHIIDLMKRSDLTEFEIEEKDLKLRICRESQKPVMYAPAPAPVAAPAAPAAAPAPTVSVGPAKPKEEPGTQFIKSPMVGTFYRAPGPDSSAFVEVGAEVKADSVVCIIEAMKVMNEIHAEAKGKILEILVENGQSVEYGQPLFKIKAS